MNETVLNSLKSVLLADARLVVEEELNKNAAAEIARKYDPALLSALQKNKDTKAFLFSETEAGPVFKLHVFLQFLNNKEFLPDSFTTFENNIGLATSDTDYLSKDGRVVLNWPYKDCVLEGGQDKEDAKRDEVFFNEVLAPDQVNRLLEPKVFTNWKRYDKDGEHPLDKLKPTDNLVIRGNNLIALHSLKKRYANKINLIYIDPPFNTGNDSFNYNDHFNHSTWLTFMKNRLEAAHSLLTDTGSIFIQLDNNEIHYLKILMDEVFGRDNFVEEYIWSYGTASGGRAAGSKPVNIHDYILHYAKNYSQRKQHKLFTRYSDKYIEEWFKYTDDDGRKYQRRMRGRDASGNTIWEKQYLDESKGVPLTSVWNDIKQVYADPRAYKEGMEHTTEIMRGFSGQKPEALIQRILEMTTDRGDIVLDYHLGSGTTASVAHKMDRQYIGIEQLHYDEKDATARLQNVINGDTAGVSKTFDWTGGGSFVYCNIKNDANTFREKVERASERDILKLFEQATTSSFLSYRVDGKKLAKELKNFKKLSLSDQKRALISLIDHNTLYLNLADIEDASYWKDDAEKKLNVKFNRQFYGEEK